MFLDSVQARPGVLLNDSRRVYSMENSRNVVLVLLTLPSIGIGAIFISNLRYMTLSSTIQSTLRPSFFPHLCCVC